MDHTQDSVAGEKQQQTPRRQPSGRRRCLMGCFGGVSEDDKPQEKPKSMNNQSCVSWSRFRSKRFPGRTVPLDSTSPENICENRSDRRSKSSGKLSFSDQPPTQEDDEIQTAAGVHGNVIKTRYGKGIVLGNSKSMNHLDSMNNFTSNHRESSLRKSKSTKTSAALCHIKQPAGPIMPELPQSVSKPPSLQTTTNDGDSQVLNRVKKVERRNQGDRAVGISIIMMILIIMVVWGKLCAILCSSVWLYFYPLLRAKRAPDVGQANGSHSVELDTNSLKYRKKVVFEGFLQRNHHII